MSDQPAIQPVEINIPDELEQSRSPSPEYKCTLSPSYFFRRPPTPPDSDQSSYTDSDDPLSNPPSPKLQTNHNPSYENNPIANGINPSILQIWNGQNLFESALNKPTYKILAIEDVETNPLFLPKKLPEK